VPADPPAPDSTVVARELADALESRGIEYALGGALALNLWAEPRGTIDVDLSLFLDPGAPTAAVQTVLELGCAARTAEAVASFLDRGLARFEYRGRRVDVYLPTLEIYESARRRRVRAPLHGRPAWFWSAEDITVFKLMFFRPKDLADVESILRNRDTSYDLGYVRSWLVRMFGDRDPRVTRFDELARAIPPRSADSRGTPGT